MSKYHGRKKSKRRIPKERIIINSLEEAKSKIGESIILSKTPKKGIKILETPFGTLRTHDGLPVDIVKNKAVLYELVSNLEDIGNDDPIERLFSLKKINEKYPNEPFINHEIGECYNSLKQWDKYDAIVKENFDKFKGIPLIDLSYVSLMLKDNQDIKDDVMGIQLNLHKVYPKIKAFDKELVNDFYTLMSIIYKNRKDYETARECVDVVEMNGMERAVTLRTSLDFAEKPWKRWRVYLIIGLIILAVLTVIIGVIWGIIKFFQWVF